MADLQNDMPPGWDCRRDENTGKYYYINHYTRTTTWEDPRNRHRPFPATPKHLTTVPTENIPMQHGSPDLRRNYVYPSQTSPIPAFQMPAHTTPKRVPLQDFKSRMSPLTVRSAKVQESPLLAADTDDSVAKISTMFPTVPETHVRMLLKNCRYMKSVFPQADETIILDILQNNENNIQKTTDALKELGFDKKDTVKAANAKEETKKEEERKVAENNEKKPVTPVQIVKTAEEKRLMREELQGKYKDVAEHLISIALESVDFDESRANQILQIMLKEDTLTPVRKKSTEAETTVVDVSERPSTSRLPDLPVSQSRQSLKSLFKTEKDVDKVSYSRVIETDEETSNKSQYLSNTKGPNPELAKGSNDKLLLEDYVKWLGPNPSLRKGPQNPANGPNPSFLSKRSYRPCGPNSELRKGSKFNLSKGSVFSRMNSIVVGESHRN